MLRSLALSIVTVAALGGTLSACKVNGEPAGGAPDLVLRAYDVPAAHAQELRNIVSSLMYRGENQARLGNVVVAPTGQLLVSAPPSFHAGVASLTDGIKRSPPPAPAAIAIEYWLVQGVPAASASMADDVPEDARDALAKLGGGKLAFTVWDHTRLVSITSERAEIERRGAEFAQTASVHGDAVVADLRVTSDVGRLEVRAALPQGKTQVLAQGAHVPSGSAEAQGSVFYVVRASLAQ